MKYDYDDVIVNVDETLLTLNIPPNYVIEKKGKKCHFQDIESIKMQIKGYIKYII